MCIRNLVKCQKSFFNLDKLSKKLSRYEKTVNYSSMKTCKLLDCYIVLQVLGFYLQGGPILHKTSGEHTVWMSVLWCICESVFVSGLHCQYGTLCAYFCVFFVCVEQIWNMCLKISFRSEILCSFIIVLSIMGLEIFTFMLATSQHLLFMVLSLGSPL